MFSIVNVMCVFGFLPFLHFSSPCILKTIIYTALQCETVTLMKQPCHFHSDDKHQYFSAPAVSNPATKNLREGRNTDLPVLDVYTVAREEGEGMETTDTESVSSASTYIPSLEQLLNSSEEKLGRQNMRLFEALAWRSCISFCPQNI